jgi:hypothetical protein
MISYFIRIYLFLIILLLASCVGGPKVDPPAFRNGEMAGAGGTSNGTSKNSSMDGGGLPTPTFGFAGNTGGQGAEDINQKSDSEANNEKDDAGSLQEP